MAGVGVRLMLLARAAKGQLEERGGIFAGNSGGPFPPDRAMTRNFSRPLFSAKVIAVWSRVGPQFGETQRVAYAATCVGSRICGPLGGRNEVPAAWGCRREEWPPRLTYAHLEPSLLQGSRAPQISS